MVLVMRLERAAFWTHLGLQQAEKGRCANPALSKALFAAAGNFVRDSCTIKSVLARSPVHLTVASRLVV